MSTSTVTKTETFTGGSFRIRVLLAFFAIYVLWGTTFLAIRIGVKEVPPFLLAGMRFLLAGTILYAWMRATGA